MEEKSAKDFGKAVLNVTQSSVALWDGDSDLITPSIH